MSREFSSHGVDLILGEDYGFSNSRIKGAVHMQCDVGLGHKISSDQFDRTNENDW